MVCTGAAQEDMQLCMLEEASTALDQANADDVCHSRISPGTQPNVTWPKLHFGRCPDLLCVAAFLLCKDGSEGKYPSLHMSK